MADRLRSRLPSEVALSAGLPGGSLSQRRLTLEGVPPRRVGVGAGFLLDVELAAAFRAGAGPRADPACRTGRYTITCWPTLNAAEARTSFQSATAEAASL
jgi:hypothetical protein